MKPELRALEQTAAEWLTRYEGGLSRREQREFERWLDEDSVHAEVFATLRRSWSRLDRLRGNELGDRLAAEPALVSGGPTYGVLLRHTRLGLKLWLGGAVAAGVVWCLAFFAWWQPQHASESYADTVATTVGEYREVRLPDGSTLQLNTSTAIEVLFTPSARRVRLERGEAVFTVAKDPARPFVVLAAGVDVQAAGTEFSVRLHTSSVEVTVREGAVRVDDAENGISLLAPFASALAEPEVRSSTLSAGHRVVIPVTPAFRPAAAPADPIPVAPVEIERSLAWRGRKLVFESAPLSSIVAELNRYNCEQLVVADAELAARRFGGTFEATDLRTFVELLRTSHAVVAEERGDETILRLP